MSTPTRENRAGCSIRDTRARAVVTVFPTTNIRAVAGAVIAMANHSNAPKPPGQRKRRNLDAHEYRYLPDEPSGLDAPPMPGKNRRGPWGMDAKLAWREWWASPMARVWLESDKIALRRALRLVDDIAAGRSTEHGALTALEDRLGLTPKARRHLQWEIDRASAREITAPRPPMPPGADPRLRVAG
jgi:hypothetical protein